MTSHLMHHHSHHQHQHLLPELSDTDLIGGGQGLEPVVLLLLVSQRGLRREVFIFGLLDRDGIRCLGEKKNIC